jgi:hypothetical protein
VQRLGVPRRRRRLRHQRRLLQRQPVRSASGRRGSGA